ncbi:MAG: hypothetical protein WC378_10170 [Opitutaceae bacterium]|jgi:hypothetical protein
MSLFLATLLTGIFLAFAGGALLSGHSLISSALKGFPRSPLATAVFFGGAALWFLFRVWNLSSADFGEYRTALFMGFFAVAALAFIYVPDFLAVRGVAGLLLLVASPLLDSAYMEWDYPQRLLLVSLVYLGIAIALWLGAQPYRMRDFLEWLYRRPARPKQFGAVQLFYGFVLCVTAFTY